MTVSVVDPTGPERELRLAIVCFGGVSLAIYMHGQTKEIHRLVRASAQIPGDDNAPSQRVYADLLSQMQQDDAEDVRTRVVVDIIAGTSAGGINGIYLAKALAHDLSQEGLRNLWFEYGDIKQLLRGPSWVPPKLKAPFLLARIHKATPLRGDKMSVWLHDALSQMDDATSGGRSLVPSDGTLQLFVTVTDFYGYNTEIAIGDPRIITDRRHRHVLQFSYRPGMDQFGADSNGALAFAARTTSCFPGAFPPVSFETFKGYFKGELDLSDLEERYFRSYQLSKAKAADTFFVDGGVLDNKPFGHVVRAIKERPASTEVDRKLLFLEPDPGIAKSPPTGDEPGPLSTVLGALSGIPKDEPILDELTDLALFNDRVARIRDIIESSFDAIGRRVEETVGESLAQLPSDPSGNALAAWEQRLNAEAAQDAGFNFATYIRLKIVGAVDLLGLMVCETCDFPPTSNQAFAVRAVLRHWARQKGLFDRSVEVLPQQTEFLQSFDLDYTTRRLRFVAAAFSWWYRDAGTPGFPSRADLDEGKRRVFSAIARLSGAMNQAALQTDLRDRITACFDETRLERLLHEEPEQPDKFASTHADELSTVAQTLRDALETLLGGLTLDLYKELHEVTARWDNDRQKDLLVRYLGFPFWDVLLYPIQAIGEVGERDHVEIVRMSPEDAKLLSVEDGAQKLKGIGLHHFAAFLERSYRENDYLWGRLDAAERLIALLIGRHHQSYVEWCKKAFTAILEEEQAGLTEVRELTTSLRSRVEKLSDGNVVTATQG